MPTSATCLRAALESLSRYFRAFKRAEKPESLAAFQEHGDVLDEILTVFEGELGGLDHLERCQYHPENSIYRLSKKILLKYFEREEETDQLILYLDSL